MRPGGYVEAKGSQEHPEILHRASAAPATSPVTQAVRKDDPRTSEHACHCPPDNGSSGPKAAISPSQAASTLSADNVHYVTMTTRRCPT